MTDSHSIAIAPACSLCGATSATELDWATRMVRTAFVDSRIVRCANCTLTFLYPIPSANDLERIYGGDYFNSYRNAGVGLADESDYISKRSKDRLFRVQQQSGAGRLLEVGIGHGRFLNFAREAGWDVYGLDISEYAIGLAKSRYGIETVARGTLESRCYPPEHFDVLHMSHVLEHLPDPVNSLRTACGLLKPGGLLIIEVPNELDNLHVSLLRQLTLTGTREYPVPSPHIFFFNPATLRRMVEVTEYQIASVATFRETADGRPVRRAAKRVFSWIENPTLSGPLLELIAHKASPA
jgi:2-polyprenyl-3-methyl-5-hydroxy-6-metoxy-1,4-benzoquinol methylase